MNQQVDLMKRYSRFAKQFNCLCILKIKRFENKSLREN